ncbi:helicase [Streptomyces armeniacus]|uniref:Helicase n=2 Tax=Streptomyces armeniacus TaxID=83291 RepID=A0A345XWT7_9ACTN|nr:DEAD/DEAH box helicase [Streptomyces armeniacus]AXK36103.1 helicase [Streptomyces armeniacus]
MVLRPHQKEALAAIVRGLSDARSGDVRGTVIMATGTGKTHTAAAAVKELAPYGRTGVLVPTLDLLAQTVEVWRRTGHRGQMVAVCSLGDDPLLEALGVRCTTDPAQLARWAAVDGPVTVLMTYASLVSQEARQEAEEEPQEGPGVRQGVLERALYGDGFTAMPAFDLLVVDEAHRTSGDLGKAWAVALDQARVPAARRLFMTATARLWEAPPAGGGEARLVASMDDESLYGPVLYELELMEAVERGLLARWEIDVLEITDPSAPGDEAEGVGSAEEGQGRRLAALQAALLTRLDEVGGRSLLTFHSTTLAAMAMARGLPGTAAELHAGDPARYPARVGAEWLCGEHAAAYRREVLARFADGVTEDGWVADAQFLSSCRVLAEGVDIRGRAGVDGVVLADARSSPVQIVQILGRALRQEPGEGKVARIIVPVFLAPGERPDAMMASGAYRPLIQVLQGLRAHDERILQRLVLATTTSSGTPTNVVELDPGTPGDVSGRAHGAEGTSSAAVPGHEGEASGDRAEGDEGRGSVDGVEVGVGVPLLRFTRPRDPAAVARWLRTRVLQPDSEVWLTGYEALRVWVETRGNAHVPAGAVIDIGGDRREYPVGQWVSEQRRALADGMLRPHRYRLLKELGMIWNVADAKFQNGLTAALVCYAEFGTLCAPRDAVVDDFALGQFLENLRKGVVVLTEARDSALCAVDPYWNPPWPVSWQRRYAALAYLLHGEDGVPVEEVQPGLRVHGVDVGAWLRRQLAEWGRLAEGQRELLGQLGVRPPAPAEARGAGGPVVDGLEHMSSFERGVAAVRQYLEREGHLAVPRRHEEFLHPARAGGAGGHDGAPIVVRPGVFLSNTKSRRTKLTPAQRAALAGLGLDWAR